ncbi:MAG: hypothetical protein KDD42_05870, partial [Bdellovibrionales bacterium]|nr:hypothetical protein [Bdellovibrionales bacterium]
MISEIVFASSNAGKAVEVEKFARRYGISIIRPDQIESEIGQAPPVVEESGKTYLENARLKAQAYYKWCRRP